MDTVNYYEVTTPLIDLLDGADLRRRVGKNYFSMTHKSSRELAEEIAQGIYGDDSWAVERHDGNVYLAINAVPQFRASGIDNFDEGIGNWTADTVTSDATNLRGDIYNFVNGGQSLEFDVAVGQSVNLRATITSTLLKQNFLPNQNLGVLLLDAYIAAQAIDVTSYTLYWGTDSSNYWTATVTADINGNAFANQSWFTLAFDWIGSSQVGSPNAAQINYFRIDMNFNGSLTSQVAYHYDSFRIVNPEMLTLYYVSFYVGTDSNGNELTTFTNTSYTDIPYFSDKYDAYVKACGHKAAAFTLEDLRLKDEALNHHAQAEQAFQRVYAIFPSSITKEIKSFAVHGINFARRNVGRTRRNNSATQS
jgi:hypothetical protein